MIDDCLESFPSLYVYFDHLAKFHKVPRNYRYICTSPGCHQVMANWYVFKRHFLGHNKNFESNTVAQPPQKSPVTSPAQSNQTDTAGISQQQDTTCSVANTTNQHIQQENRVQHESLYHEDLEEICQAVVELTLELHNETNLSRVDTRNVQKKTSLLTSKIADKIEKLIPFNLVEPQTVFELKGLLKRLQSPFDFIDSDFKFFKYLENLNIFRYPYMIAIENNKPVIIDVNDVKDKDATNYLVMINIEFQIKAFFSVPEVLETTLTHTAKLEACTVKNSIATGTAWKAIREKYQTELLIPISLYTDDFEINDNLSSHNKKHSICGVYYSFPTIPDQYSSKLCNIFVAAMVKKVDLNEHGINCLFKYILQKFKQIEDHGISFTLRNGSNVKVRFVLTILQGDNLGMHQMMQFLTFNANHYCRFCRRSREQCQADTEEYVEFRRTIQNYRSDVELNRPSETGIRGESVFNLLPSFHVVDNLSVDLMHDFYSGGVCTFGLTAVMNYCVYQKKFISLSKFNAHKSFYSKTILDSSLSRMPDINDTFLSNKKANLS